MTYLVAIAIVLVVFGVGISVGRRKARRTLRGGLLLHSEMYESLTQDYLDPEYPRDLLVKEISELREIIHEKIRA